MNTEQRDTQFLAALRDIIKPNYDAHIRRYRQYHIAECFKDAPSQGTMDWDNMPVGGLEEMTLGEIGQ